MKVAKLIAELQKASPEAEVYLRNAYGSPVEVDTVAPVKGYARNVVVDKQGIILLEPVDW